MYTYLDQLKIVDVTSQIEGFKKSNMDAEVKELRKLNNELEGKKSELLVLNSGVPKSLMGKSSFTPERLNTLIEATEVAVAELEIAVENAEGELKSKESELFEMEELKKYIPVWGEVFENASIEKKKMMLSTIIDNIVVYRDKIDITFKIQLTQFVGTMGTKTFKNNNTNNEDVVSKVLSYNAEKQYVV